jgi:beta-1,4-mannosyl-glycoprotein beta-1,4-N-acetylglucosaminyltransferase
MKWSSRFGPARWVRALLVVGAFLLAARFLMTARNGRRQITAADAAWTGSALQDGAGSLGAKEGCRKFGWRPFQARSPDAGRRKVYDLFMVNTELDWLEVRLNSTYDHVDYFVIVEGRTSFQGREKALTIKDNWHLLAPYKDKIIYHELEYPEDFHPIRSWDFEDLQRNAMFEQVLPRLSGVHAPNEGDVIIVADVDEIVRPATVEVLRQCEFPRRLTLRSKFFYYGFQYLHAGAEWQHPQATFYEGAQTIRPVNLRNGDGGLSLAPWRDKAELWNAGWHCSTCFATVEEVLGKMSSFSHMLLNKDEFRDRARIAQRVRSGRDLWDRKGEVYIRLENNTDVPSAVLANKERFAYLWDRSGPSAGFRDYPP